MLSKYRSLLTGIVILILGFSIGVYFQRYEMSHYCRKSPFGFYKGERSLEDQMNFLNRKLDLTSEQQSKVTEILTLSRSKLQELHLKISPQYKEIREQTRNEIKELLTPEQQLKFEEMRRKKLERMNRRRE